MASVGPEILQQRPNVESRIKSLVNNDLKEICKAYNVPVSGTKAILQKRCITVLDGIIAKGDPAAFDAFRYRVSNHGAAPPTGYAQSSYSGGAGYRPSSMTPNGIMRPAPGASSMNLTFKASPFYKILETVLRPQDLPEMPQNRHTVKADIKLSDDQVRKLKDNPNMRILIYCGQYMGGINAYTALDVAFPNQIEVKVNADDVKANFKGLKNKPGSTKPADITDKLRKVTGYPNQISVCYALTSKRYQYVVYMVEHITADELTRRPHRVIQKQTVIEEMNKANADPDIAATSSKMSLKDPVSTMRITIPVRATVCSHNQCFDLSMFMQLQEQAPTWQCPICSKTVSFDSLCVDKYFEEILSTTSKSIEQVTIEPNGDWSVDKEDEDKGKSNQAKGEARAAYDDDFEDDLVEVMDPPKEANGFKREYQLGYTSINTPPLSTASREASIASAQRPASGNKRPANAVIDLTLSDDDEPPRPAKRQTTGNQLHTTNSYNTPSSIPDPPRYQAYTQQPAESAGSYRHPSGGQCARANYPMSGQQSPSLLPPHPLPHPSVTHRPSHSPANTANNYLDSSLSTFPNHRSNHSFVGGQPAGHQGQTGQQQQHSLRLPLGRPQQQQGHGQQEYGQEEYGNWRGDYGDYGQYSSPS